MSPRKLHELQLQPSPTTTATFQTAMGDFTTSYMIELSWKGRGATGQSVFYVLPDETSVDGVMVGIKFIKNYTDGIFADEKPTPLVMLTAAAPMSVSAVACAGPAETDQGV